MEISERLKLFCDSDDGGRYDLSKPMRQGEWIVAADHHVAIAVRIGQYEGPDVEKSDKPDVLSVCRPASDDAEFTRLDELPPCECDGDERKCIVCGGSGEHWCDECETGHECGSCYGEGHTCIVKFGDEPFDRRLVEKFSGLRDLSYRFEYTDTRFPKLLLRFHEGVGAVMGMRL